MLANTTNLELKWQMLGLSSNDSFAHLEVILIVKNRSKIISKEGLTSSLHLLSRSGESHAPYHRDWTMAGVQTVQLGLREIITRTLTIYFVLIWQLCQQQSMRKQAISLKQHTVALGFITLMVLSITGLILKSI